MTQPADCSNLMPLTLHLNRALMTAAMAMAKRAGTSLPAFVEQAMRQRIGPRAIDQEADHECAVFCNLAEGNADEMPDRFRMAYSRICGPMWERYWIVPRMSYEQLDALPTERWPAPTVNRTAVRREWKTLFDELAAPCPTSDEADATSE